MNLRQIFDNISILKKNKSKKNITLINEQIKKAKELTNYVRHLATDVENGEEEFIKSFERTKNFKIMANPNISDTAKKINRNPNKFVERLFYDKYSNDKKKYNKNNSYYYNNKKDEKKKKSSENKNFSYRPTINKKRRR